MFLISRSRIVNTGAAVLGEPRVNSNSIMYLIHKTKSAGYFLGCKGKLCLTIGLVGNAKRFSYIFHFFLPVSSVSLSVFSFPDAP